MTSNTSVDVAALALTRSEESRLVELESTIEDGLDTFVEVGSALAAIRNARLYRGEFGTFEEYCRTRWQMVASRARQLIASAEAVGNLESVTNVTPATESQVRPLVALAPAEQRQAWTRAEEIAEEEGTPIRARHVEQAVQERKPRVPKYDIEKLSAETLVESWRVELVSITDAVDDTLTSKLPRNARSLIWSDVVEPMIRELQKLNPARGNKK